MHNRCTTVVLIAACLVFAVTGVVSADILYIQVDSPAAASVCNVGADCQIHWYATNTSGSGFFPPVWVKLLLYPSGQFNSAITIAEFAITDSSTDLGWTVPSNVSAGSYVIRVQTRDMVTYTDQDGKITYGYKYGESGVFTIAKPAIQVVLPGQPGWKPPPGSIPDGPITPAGKAVGAEKKESAAAKKFANLSVIDLSGQWQSSIGIVYDVAQKGNQFEWTVAKTNEKGQGTVQGSSVSASWNGPQGSGSSTGQITATDANGKATQIEWKNGVRFYR